MKTGKLSLNFQDGLIINASIGAGLQETYDRLFQAARMDLESDSADVDVSVRVVVFGCMLVEAMVADCIEALLSSAAIPPAARDALVLAVERSPAGQKVKIVA